jgi:signal transduction histidine kinase
LRSSDVPPEPAGGARIQPLDILVVDDDPANLMAIEAVLGDLTVASRVVTARSGQEALKRLLEQDVALILLDVHMPTLDGLETARLIRKRQRTRHVPIIFVTAYGQSDARVLEGYQLGAVDFLFKPVVPEVLRAKAGVFVELQSRANEVARQAEELRRHEQQEARHRLEEERRAWEERALRRQMDEQRRATDEVARKAEELARTVAEREAVQKELTRINAQLARADRRKDEFIATLAHELRNPLAPLSYGLGLLEGVHDAVLQEAKQRMERQLAHLQRLVDDLLDVSRVTSGKIELRRQPLDLRDAIQHAVDVSRPVVEARRHALRVDLPREALPVHGDPVRLSQVVSNLLNNAAHYTEPGGRIEVRARIDEHDVVVAVVDDGQGIAPELLDHIFGAFVQGRAGGGGLGLGLHLVQHLVRLHDGQVRAQSDGLGLGATFEVRLPRAPEEPGTKADPEPTDATSVSRLSVVVVEDQEDVREMLSLLLSRWGHRAHAVGDGGSGIRLVSEVLPDVALIDIGLPDMEGYEVARRLRATLGATCPPLVAVTGWGQADDRRRAMEVGFSQHLVKPVSPRALRQVLALHAANKNHDAEEACAAPRVEE